MLIGIRRRAVFALAIAALALMAGCSGEDGAMGPAGPPGPVEPTIYGLVVRSNYEAYYDLTELINCQAYVNVSNIYTVPYVAVNGRELSPFVEGIVYANGLNYWSGIFLDMGEDATLNLDYQDDGDDKSAGATVAVPDTFDLLSSDGDPFPVIISPGGSFTMEWESAPGADNYWLMIDYNGSYMDTGGNRINFYRELSRVVPDTTYTLYGSDIFPDRDDIDYYTSFGGRVYIYGASGPMAEGDQSNIEGDATGMFRGITECSRNVRFVMPIITSETTESPEIEEPGIDDLIRRFMPAR